MYRLILVLLILGALSIPGFGQTNSAPDSTKKAVDSLPYLKYPTMPAFNILSIDSTTIFNTYNIPTGSPTVLMFFDPDCKHCKATMKALLKGMDSIKNVQFYVFSARHDMSMIRGFANNYHLQSYPNIKVIGMDTEFFFFSFFKVRFVPDLAVYDGDKNFVKLYQGSVTVKELYELTHK